MKKQPLVESVAGLPGTFASVSSTLASGAVSLLASDGRREVRVQLTPQQAEALIHALQSARFRADVDTAA